MCMLVVVFKRGKERERGENSCAAVCGTGKPHVLQKFMKNDCLDSILNLI